MAIYDFTDQTVLRNNSASSKQPLAESLSESCALSSHLENILPELSRSQRLAVHWSCIASSDSAASILNRSPKTIRFHLINSRVVLDLNSLQELRMVYLSRVMFSLLNPRE